MQKGRLNVRLIFMVFMVSISIFAKAQNITIQVVDEANNPLSEVLVSVKQSTDTICMVKTDTKGLVQCSNLIYGSLVIEASKENYQTAIMNSWYSIQSRDVLTIQLFRKLVVFLDSMTINASHQMAEYNGQILVTRSQYKTMAGSFQDPSRVMLHFPGYSTDNDGTNAFFFRGLPGYATHWQINDAEIVNPNHLITAGNRGDAISLNSGGVNALTSSIIGSYKFLSNPASIVQANTTGGVSNLQLAKKLNNYTDISLIGLEAGICSKFSDKYTYATARYSFVGLLEKLGVPFGDESINYQDFSFVSELIKSKTFFLKSYAIYGQSRNDHPAYPVDSIKTTFKDFKNIQYKSQLGIAGLTGEYTPGKGRTYLFTLNYSGRTDQEVENLGKEYQSLFVFDSINRQDKLHVISGHLQLKQNSANNFFHSGIRLNSNFQQRITINDKEFRNYSRMYPYLEFKHLIKTWTLGGGIGLHVIIPHGAQPRFVLNYSASIQKEIRNGMIVKGLHRYSDQLIPVFLKNVDFLHIKTAASEISIGKHFGSFAWRIGAYIMFIRDNLAAEIEDNNKVSTFNGLDFNVDNPVGQQTSLHDARTYGLESWCMKSINLGKNSLDLIGNLSYAKSFYKFSNETWLPSKTNIGFSGSIAGYLTKQNKRTEWNIGFIYHARQGLGEYSYGFMNGEFQWNTNLGLTQIQSPYQRLDVRVVFTKKVSGKRQHRISMDIQNVLNRKNDGYTYYDPYLMQPYAQKQLGLVPVIGYRYEF